MLTIFISYSRNNHDAVATLANDFETLGNVVWFDKELDGGQAWWMEILTKIRESDLFVFAVSSESVNSTACTRECSYALDLEKSILPVLVGEDVSINLLPPTLADLEFIDFRQKDRNSALCIAKALSNIKPNKILPNPLPPQPDPVSYLGRIKDQIDSSSTLSFEAQSALLVKLKEQLSDLKISADARTLLLQLRKRDDLFAKIDREIDTLLRSTKHNDTDSENTVHQHRETEHNENAYSENQRQKVKSRKDKVE